MGMCVLNQEIILGKIEKNIDTLRNLGVLKLGLFGSYARNDEDPQSDIDFFVEFEKGKKNFDNYMNLKFFLEDLFQSSIDLVTAPAIRPEWRQNIIRSLIYASGL